MEWSVAFYQDGVYDKALSQSFARRVDDNSYQYFDFSYGNKRIVIHKQDQYENPDHNERWKRCLHMQSLAGKRILDLGANWGFWSLQCLALGAGSVTLIESDGLEIADFLLKHFGLRDKAELIVTDVRKFMPEGRYDLSLVLRLLHFLNKTDRNQLLKRVFAASQIAIINPVEPYLLPSLRSWKVRFQTYNMDNHYLSTAKMFFGTNMGASA